MAAMNNEIEGKLDNIASKVDFEISAWVKLSSNAMSFKSYENDNVRNFYQYIYFFSIIMLNNFHFKISNWANSHCMLQSILRLEIHQIYGKNKLL